jgi:hypothetical protein
VNDTLTKAQCVCLTDTNSALHEAGHLAAAISLGIPAIARIGYDGYSSGRTNYDPIGVSLENSLLIIFGGIVVTEKFQLRKAGLVLDFADIDKALLPLSATESAAIKAKARLDAENFVEQHLGCILRLAFALVKWRALDEPTAKKVFAGEITFEASDEFCEALQLLPRAMVPVEHRPPGSDHS